MADVPTMAEVRTVSPEQAARSSAPLEVAPAVVTRVGAAAGLPAARAYAAERERARARGVTDVPQHEARALEPTERLDGILVGLRKKHDVDLLLLQQGEVIHVIPLPPEEAEFLKRRPRGDVVKVVGSGGFRQKGPKL